LYKKRALSDGFVAGRRIRKGTVFKVPEGMDPTGFPWAEDVIPVQEPPAPEAPVVVVTPVEGSSAYGAISVGVEEDA
jgi:hypothetical protein